MEAFFAFLYANDGKTDNIVPQEHVFTLFCPFFLCEIGKAHRFVLLHAVKKCKKDQNLFARARIDVYEM